MAEVVAEIKVNLNLNDLIIERARIFATSAHAAVGQKRKYTGEDYITHPQAVCEILRGFVGDAVTSEMYAAAWLHDVIEDTQVTRELILEEFGATIFSYVIGLTNKSTSYDGNREKRKLIDRKFLAQQCAEVQTIKVADLMHNTESIVEHDKKFAMIYLLEKIALLEDLTKANIHLRNIAIDKTFKIYSELRGTGNLK